MKHQGPAAGNIVKGILAGKAQIWQRVPFRSPLYRAYRTLLTEGEIVDAYRQLFDVMTMPLEKLLGLSWEK
jgi:hypothetical protein